MFFYLENKSKRDLIQMLVQKGFESDPVKAWKEAQEKVQHFCKHPKLRAYFVLAVPRVAHALIFLPFSHRLQKRMIFRI